MAKVLLVEDDVAIAELIRFNLEREGYIVSAATDGLQGLNMAMIEKPDLILLDLMLPGLDGYEICKHLKRNIETSSIPIIMLSARSEEFDKVLGLELGANDYMVKPFSPKELIARIKARLRDAVKVAGGTQIAPTLRWAEVELWPENYIVTLAGKALNLTVKEFELLHLFMLHPNQVFSREHLLQKIWGYHNEADTRTVDVHVSNLRQKMGVLGKNINTVRGVGYRLTPVAE